MAKTNQSHLSRLILLVIIFCFGSSQSSTCEKSNKVCEYWLTAEESLTLMHGKDLVYASNGNLIKYDEFPDNFTTNIPIDEVISVDGFQRLVQVFNKTIPGPPIIVYEGQTIVVHVTNLLLSNALSVHWHGLHQRETPWMDGVPMVTQCPILPHQTFTYRFKAYPSGTFWYHSHVAGDRNNGLYGAFIIKEKDQSHLSALEDVIVTVGDWHHADSSEVYLKKTTATYFGRHRYQKTFTFDGAELTPIPWLSGLIQGKGRFYDQYKGEEIKSPLTWFTVKSGSSYRYRVIHTGYVYPLRVSIDNHTLEVIASDGYLLKPVVCDGFILNPGERFDFVLQASASSGNYWIRTESIEDNVYHHHALAVLHYEDAPLSMEPITQKKNCTISNRCLIVNCPFIGYPTSSNTDCLTFNDLEGHTSLSDAPGHNRDEDPEHFLNFAYPGYTVFPGSINGRGFLQSHAPRLTQPLDSINLKNCSTSDCGIDKICWCHHETSIPSDKNVQIILSSVGSGKSATHPIHLHGYGFHVIKVGYPQYNSTSGVMIGQNQDILCEGRFCNNAKWKPGLGEAISRSTKAPVKDTLNIPVGGYAVIRFHSDNKGKWLIHCHTAIHVMDGMAMVIDVDGDSAIPPPRGFPICNNFKNDPNQDVSYLRDGVHSQHSQNNTIFIVVAVILLFVVVILSVVVIYLLKDHRKSDGKHSEAVMELMRKDENVMT